MDRFVFELASSATVTASSVVNAENELRERDIGTAAGTTLTESDTSQSQSPMASTSTQKNQVNAVLPVPVDSDATHF